MENEDVFYIKARRCQRCGGILLSQYGLKHGMGHVCKQKYDAEHAPIDPNQLTLEMGELAEISPQNDAEAAPQTSVDKVY